MGLCYEIYYFYMISKTKVESVERHSLFTAFSLKYYLGQLYWLSVLLHIWCFYRTITVLILLQYCNSSTFRCVFWWMIYFRKCCSLSFNVFVFLDTLRKNVQIVLVFCFVLNALNKRTCIIILKLLGTSYRRVHILIITKNESC